MNKFVCSECGNRGEIKSESDKTCLCGKLIEVEELYPSLDATSFIGTAIELYDSCKSTAKVNKLKIYDLLSKEKGINISMDDVTNYIELYEKQLNKHSDNKLSNISSALDGFEDSLGSMHNYDDTTISEIKFLIANKWVNRLRKPFVIMAASSIEMLFNDYFKLLLKYKLGEKGANLLLDKYKTSGIQECISICNVFINTSLKEEIDAIKPAFFDKWQSLRNDRNGIIHSNNKYISMKRTHDIEKLLNESIEIFWNLKSNILKSDI